MTNYVKLFEDGTTEATLVKPSWGMYEKESATDNRDVLVDGKWYPTTGGELVTNGTFDADISGWTSVGVGIVSWSLGTLSFDTNGGGAYQLINTTIGTSYTVTYQANANCSMYIQSTFGNTIASSVNGVVQFIAETTTTHIMPYAIGGAATHDNISVFKTEPTIGTAYNPQFTYLSKDGKLAGIEVADGSPVDIHHDELAPDLVRDTIQAGNLVVTEDIACDNYTGKNACTAWVNFDGTTTPPTIRDSFNVSDVVRVSTGVFDIYFENEMKTLNCSSTFSQEAGGPALTLYSGQIKVVNNQKATVYSKLTNASTTSLYNGPDMSVQIFGGKN